MAEGIATSPRKRPIGLIIGVLVSFVLAVAALSYLVSEPRLDIGDIKVPEATLTPPAAGDAGRPAETDAYVGSARCAECHQELFDRYQSHSMARSFASLEAASEIEDYTHARISPPGRREYRVERTGAECTHFESMVGDDGQRIYDQGVPVRYALGSGQRGRSYLINRNGLLFQSPIGWYSTTSQWDLSPGYLPDNHARFSRRVGNGCLFCHVGSVNEVKAKSDRYGEPVFFEEAIGCERCHGPGKRHAEAHASGRKLLPDAETIVNPARLEPERREAVCNQCHLQGARVILRAGKSFWDFRPGQHLDDVWLPFLQGESVADDGTTEAVSQVEQMQASKCFQGSDGRLGCISCHDSHGLPDRAQRAELYQQRCLECHAQRSCSLDPALQAAPPAAGSCVHCHMPALKTRDVPHTAQTDHRILRNPDQEIPPAVAGEPNSVRLFGQAEQRVPKAVVDRCRGMLLTELVKLSRSERMASTARELLLPGTGQQLPARSLDRLGDDVDALEALGTLYSITRQPYFAVACWEQVLRFEPEKESVLAALADLYYHHGNYGASAEYLQRLIAVNPYLSDAYFRMADLASRERDLTAAIRQAEQGLELDPSAVPIRQWLVDAYRLAGQDEKRAEQEAILRRMSVAPPPSSQPSR